MKNIFIFMIVAISTISCGNQTKAKKTSEKIDVIEKIEVTEKVFQMPSVPSYLATQEEKTKYFLMNYWDNYDFRDTTLISNKTYTERAYVEFLGAINYAKEDIVKKAVTRMLDSASVNSFTLANFEDITERYLNDPNSPLASEELYIIFLERHIENPHIEELSKIRPKYKLKLAKKNRVGDKALDFTYTDIKGKVSNMHNIVAETLLIFFYDPDCPVCEGIMNALVETEGVWQLMNRNKLKILALYADDDIPAWKKYSPIFPKTWINGYNESGVIFKDNLYDLRAAPVMYLLDKDKTVVLKDGNIKQVFDLLSRVEI